MKQEKFISQCSYCRKVRRKEGFKFTGDKHKHMDEWDHHDEDLKDLEKDFELIYSHGMCDPCADDCMKDFEDESKGYSKIQ